jgi:PAS domain S-box-containing protein
MVLIAFVPVLLGLLIDGAISRNRAIKDAVSSSIEEVTLAAASQRRQIGSAYEILATLSTMPEVAALDGEACGARLRSLIKKLPNFANIGLLNDSGYLVCSALGERAQESFSNRSYFKEARDTKRFSVSEILYAHISGSRSIIFGYPLYDRHDKFRGVIFATFADNEFASLPSAKRQNLVSNFEYFDRQGNLITAEPWASKALTKGLSTADLELASNGNSVISNIVDQDGKKYMTVLSEVEDVAGNHMFVRGVLPEETMLASWRSSVLRRSVAVLAALLSGLLVTGWFLRKWLVHDLFWLVDFTKAVNTRRIHSLPMRAQTAETSMVMHAVVEMTRSLHAQKDELLHLHQQMQRKEQLLQQALSIARLGTWEIDVENGNAAFSEDLLQMLGIAGPTRRLSLRCLVALLHPDDRSSFIAHCKSMVRNLQPIDTTLRTVRADRTVRYFHLRGAPSNGYADGSKRFCGILQDITVQHEELEKLKLLEAAVRRVNDLVLVISAEPDTGEPKIVFINRPLEGKTPGEQITEASILIRHALSVVNSENFIAALAKTGMIREEIVRYGNDGKPLWLEMEIVPVAYESAIATHWIAVQRDITERRKSEQALRSSEESYRNMFQNHPLPMWMYDVHSLGFLQVNQAAVQMYGYSREEFLAMHLPDIHLDDDRHRVRIAAMGRNSFRTDRIWRQKMKNGIVRTVEIITTAMVIEKRAVQLVTPIDVTDRLLAEQQVLALNASLEQRVEQRTRELEISENRYRTLAETAPQIVWSGTVEQGCIYINKAWSKLVGEPESNALHQGWLSYIHPDDRERFLQRWKDAAAKKISFSIDCRHKTASGDYLHFICEAAPVSSADGTTELWVGINTDVTQLKHAQESLMYANRELESFSYSVSHDLRAPLQTIEGFSHILLSDFSQDLSSQAREYLGKIQASSKHMAHLIDDLLKLARLSRSEFQFTESDLSVICNDIALELREVEPERKMTIDIEPDMRLVADPRLLRIAMSNLISNAWKFTRRCEAAKIEIGKFMQEGTVVYFVRDNGAGFDMRYADNLFGVFRRLHSVRDFPGTGIGLATVQRIIARHHGKIWTEAYPNRGATFFFTIGSKPA